MAFNRPIDADRVDDLGLLSSFLRAPIIGPIIWVIGKLARHQEAEQHDPAVCPPDPRESFTTSIDDSVMSIDHGSLESLPSITTDPIDMCSDDSMQQNMEPDGPLQSNHFKQDLKKARKTSWSDESGHRLAKYYDEVREHCREDSYIGDRFVGAFSSRNHDIAPFDYWMWYIRDVTNSEYPSLDIHLTFSLEGATLGFVTLTLSLSLFHMTVCTSL